MRVSSINNSVNFKGLWSKTTLKSDFDKILGVLKVTQTSYYHPFQKENPEHVKEIIDENNVAFIDDSTNIPRYMVFECKKCLDVPYTEDVYNTYVQAHNKTRLSPTIKKINEYVQDKYKNNAYGKQQISAVNGVIDYRIKKNLSQQN